MTTTYSATLFPDGFPCEAPSAAIVPWWSFTKTLISVAAIILDRRKRLSLDRSLPGLPYSLRELLQHTAGVGNYGGMPEYHAAVAQGDPPWQREELFARIPPTQLLFAPGAGWAYSNVGYLLAREVIEYAYEDGLEHVLRDLVLGPLGLKNSRLAETPGDMQMTVFGAGQEYNPKWVFHGTVMGPVVEAAQTLHGILTGDLLSSSERYALLTRHPIGGAIPGRPWLTTGYGLGLMIGMMQVDGMVKPLEVIGHSAGGPGSVGAVYHAPEYGRTSAVFVAQVNDEGLAERRALQHLLNH